ncbi:MAG: hypothetical protein IIA54_07405, partial [Chloroflexi bacterium]|nr:hypothetical protein [Chloroflexota bacterium]
MLDANAFSDRLAGRMERVAAKAGRAPRVEGFTPPGQGWPDGPDSSLVPPSRMARLQGFVVSMIVALGLSVGAAIVTGDQRFFEKYFGVTFGFILALRLGISVSGWVNRRMAAPNPTCWVTGPITLACCVLPVLLVMQMAQEAIRGSGCGLDPREV